MAVHTSSFQNCGNGGGVGEVRECEAGGEEDEGGDGWGWDDEEEEEDEEGRSQKRSTLPG